MVAADTQPNWRSALRLFENVEASVFLFPFLINSFLKSSSDVFCQPIRFEVFFRLILLIFMHHPNSDDVHGNWATKLVALAMLLRVWLKTIFELTWAR